MPQPNRLHVDAPLTNLSVAFDQSDESFIFDKVFPIVPVDDISGMYWEFPLEDWLRDEAQLRAGGTESAGGGFGVQRDAYLCKLYAWHKDIDDQTLAQSDSSLQLDRAAARFVVNRLRMRQEKQFLADFFGTGKWGTDMAGVASNPTGNQFVKFSNPNNSTPLSVVQKGQRQILSQTGLRANKLVIGYDVYDALRLHPDILDRTKYTSADAITQDILARYFDVDEVLVSTSVGNSAQEGQPAQVGFNLGKSMLLVHAAEEVGLETPSAGYQFRWRGVSNGLGTTIGTSRFRMEQLKADRVEGEIAFDNKIVSKPLGVYFDAVVD